MRKNKKILLGAISALSLVAIGTGAVSTFAWYAASSGATPKKATNDSIIITTTEFEYSVTDVQVPMKVTASAVTTGLGLAHYNATCTGTNKLSTGYVDLAGNFVDLGKKGGEGADQNDAKLYGSITTLTSTFTIVVSVNYSDSGWKTAGGSQAADDGSDASYFQDALGNKISKTTILSYLSGDKIDVGIKPASGSRICFIGASDAADGNAGILAGLAKLSSPDNSYLAAATNVALGADGSWTGSTLATTEFYVFGQKNSADTNIDEDGFDCGVELVVRPYAA